MKLPYWVIVFFIPLFVGIYWFPQIIKHEKEIQFEKLFEQARVIDQEMHGIRVQKRQQEPIHIPILMYHYVEIVTDLNDTLRMSQNIPPNIFEAQLVTLLTDGYTPIFMSEFMNYFAGLGDLPSKPVVLTFDDGYQDFYTDVFPILQKYRIKAVNYVVSGFVGRDKNYLNLPQLQELAASPLIEIGAHGVSHQDLPYLNLFDLEKEVYKSKTQLESMVKKPVLQFAYPYGRYSPKAIAYVIEAGFESAVTTDEGTTQTYKDRFILKRIRPGRATGDALLDRIQ